MLLFFLAPVAEAVASADRPVGEAIVVTAAREPERRDEAPASTSVLGRPEIAALALPIAADLLRLTPGLSVGISGPRGSQTQVRIRGAEANHTLLFVDGIRFNDPAAGNEARFELLGSDALSRIEVVRGPQSALWGSEALGGVVAVETADPRRAGGLEALGEYGSLASGRASASGATRAGPLSLSGSAGWMGSRGIDSFARGGERDGFDNRAASAKAVLAAAPNFEIGLVGHWVEARSDYDGFDPASFVHAETLDETRNRIGAGRAWVSASLSGWNVSADASWLGSRNRNLLAGAPLNRTAGERLTGGAQLSRSVGAHRFTAAYSHETERFHARDQIYFGGTDQDRQRSLDAVAGEWRAQWARFLSTDLAVRRDSFSAFHDATTVRAAALLSPGGGFRLHAAWGEGIAQPTFYDLYGFFPGSFLGNAALKPERSEGWEAGLAWEGHALSLGVTGFSNRLEDEIVDVFDPATFQSSTANASGRSRRRGVEAEASWRPSPAFQLAANYSFLDAGERRVAGTALVREVRRPHHSANLVATGTMGRFSFSFSGAWVGARTDVDFDSFPARNVRLGDYLLASARVAYRITEAVEAYVRAENGFGADYQDAFGYRTPGRTVYAGLRLRLGD